MSEPAKPKSGGEAEAGRGAAEPRGERKGEGAKGDAAKGEGGKGDAAKGDAAKGDAAKGAGGGARGARGDGDAKAKVDDRPESKPGPERLARLLATGAPPLLLAATAALLVAGHGPTWARALIRDAMGVDARPLVWTIAGLALAGAVATALLGRRFAGGKRTPALALAGPALALAAAAAAAGHLALRAAAKVVVSDDPAERLAQAGATLARGAALLGVELHLAAALAAGGALAAAARLWGRPLPAIGRRPLAATGGLALTTAAGLVAGALLLPRARDVALAVVLAPIAVAAALALGAARLGGVRQAKRPAERDEAAAEGATLAVLALLAVALAGAAGRLACAAAADGALTVAGDAGGKHLLLDWARQRSASVGWLWAAALAGVAAAGVALLSSVGAPRPRAGGKLRLALAGAAALVAAGAASYEALAAAMRADAMAPATRFARDDLALAASRSRTPIGGGIAVVVGREWVVVDGHAAGRAGGATAGGAVEREATVRQIAALVSGATHGRVGARVEIAFDRGASFRQVTSVIGAVHRVAGVEAALVVRTGAGSSAPAPERLLPDDLALLPLSPPPPEDAAPGPQLISRPDGVWLAGPGAPDGAAPAAPRTLDAAGRTRLRSALAALRAAGGAASLAITADGDTSFAEVVELVDAARADDRGAPLFPAPALVAAAQRVAARPTVEAGGAVGGAALQGSIEVGPPDATGGLEPGAARAAVRAGVRPLQACYGLRLAQRAFLEGTVTLAFDVGADGRIGQVTVASASLSDAAMTSCLVDAARGLSFPSRPLASKLLVPLTFKPPAPSE